ncbi:hypothetical protein B0H13DRAFT_1851364 [Mycena leptocephala]|nr:hypothetical protein B0H13DRAFT_1851364 [Mycena leptocephala]
MGTGRLPVQRKIEAQKRLHNDTADDIAVPLQGEVALDTPSTNQSRWTGQETNFDEGIRGKIDTAARGHSAVTFLRLSRYIVMHYAGSSPGVTGSNEGEPEDKEGGSAVPPTSQFFAPRTAKPSSSVVRAKRSNDSDDDPSDKNYQPPRNPPAQSEEDTDGPEDVIVVLLWFIDSVGNIYTFEEVTRKAKGKGKSAEELKEKAKISKAKQTKLSMTKPPAKKLKQANVSDSDSEPPIDDADAPVTKIGRNPKRGRWVITNYLSPPTLHQNKNSQPVWRWECRWCSTYRTSARTLGCTKYADETIPLVVDSNFHSHLRSCKRIPDDATFEAWEAAEAAEKAGTQPVPVGSTSTVALQRQTMNKFVQDGIDNPAVVVTQRGFRKFLVEGIALDDLSFSFPKGKGMNRLFTYLIPRGWKIPGRKTVKSGITLLSSLLRARIDSLVLTCGRVKILSMPFAEVWGG